MVSFFGALVLLLVGYFCYGKLVEKVFSPKEQATPAVVHQDGVDYVPMADWKVFLIQLLNIAGTGPIFGALMGAVFGPVVFLWIVFGSILGGAVHDYFTGMISLRLDGISVSGMVGEYLGNVAKQIMRVFSIVLLILSGAVFTTSPAVLIARLTPEWMNETFWVVVILVYYFLATLLPIDKLIGKIYPIFGIALILMAISISAGIFTQGYTIPEISLQNLHPENKPIWPYMFVTVACGAISGFHSTQSPLMARCLQHEKSGRKVFYGAMIAESVIALVWAAAGVAYYNGTKGLSDALAQLNQSGVVYDVSVGLLGIAGGALAIIGVVVCPISSGDTTFRSARLTIADWFGIEQEDFRKRIAVTVPILAVGGLLTQIDFDVIWRYFSWSNQTLAMIVLWSIAVYLLKFAKKRFYCLIAVLPATFMTAVSVTYILVADEGLKIAEKIAYPIGIAAALLAALWFVLTSVRKTERR